MKLTSSLTIALLLTLRLFAQEDQLKQIINEGIALHDQGKYNEAITKYREALEMDSKSALANYELAYSAFLNKQYDTAIKYSSITLDINTLSQHESYMVLGSSLDMVGNPAEAIKVYEKGLKKYSNSNLLHYNLALTCFNQQDYKKAEKAAIEAITARSGHASSHVILSAIMQQKGERVKSLLPTYYFLMLEPASQRSAVSYKFLVTQLGQGVEKKDDKNINITIPLSSSKSDDFGPAEMMLGLLAASKHTEENEKKTEMEMFVETNKGLFSVLGELKEKKHKGLWWELYVTKFYDLVNSGHLEAFSYYISQSANAEPVNKWIAGNSEKMKQLVDWMKNQ